MRTTIVQRCAEMTRHIAVCVEGCSVFRGKTWSVYVPLCEEWDIHSTIAASMGLDREVTCHKCLSIFESLPSKELRCVMS